MTEKTYLNVNACKLHIELVDAGIPKDDIDVFDLGNDTALIQFQNDVDITLVESIVSKHDKTPLPLPKSELEMAQNTINSLGIQLAQEKISRIQNENIIDMLGKEIVNMKLGGV